jgi:hypothetical protein
MYDIDTTIAMLQANPGFMARFGANSPASAEQGLANLREHLRGAHYKELSSHSPVYAGLYQRADSIEDVNRNEAYIRKTVERRIADPAYRADADDGLIFARQLEQIDPRRFEVKYRPRGMWRDILPTRDIARGMQYLTWRTEDFRAQAQPVTVGTVEDIPYVGASTEEESTYIIDKALGYRYTQMELDAAAFANVPLQDRYQKAVMYGYEEAQDNIAFGGDTERDLEGLINHTGVTNVQAAAPASGTDRKWSGTDKTNDEKVADIRGMVTKVATQSEENYNAERTRFVLLLPRTPYDALNVRMAAGTDTTVLEFILRQEKYGIADIKVKPQLAGQGTGSTDLAILMPVMDSEVMEFNVSDAIIWEPAQFVGLDVRFPSRMRQGGLVIRYPIAMTQLYGI